MQKLKNVQTYAKISDTPFDQRSLIHREVWLPGGSRIPKNQIFLKNGKIIQNKKSQKRLEICQYQRYVLRTEISNPSGSRVSTLFCKAKSAKKKKMRGNFRQFSNKNVQMLDHFFPLLFPKDSESLKILHIRLREVGAKRPLNSTSKVNGQTDTHTDRRTFQLIESIGPEGQCFENYVFGFMFL